MFISPLKRCLRRRRTDGGREADGADAAPRGSTQREDDEGPGPPNSFDGWSHLAAAGTAAGHRNSSITARGGVKKKKQHTNTTAGTICKRRYKIMDANAGDSSSRNILCSGMLSLGASSFLQPHYFCVFFLL